MNKSVAGKIVVYSANKIMTIALEALSYPESEKNRSVIVINDLDKLPSIMSTESIQCAILDIAPHSHAYWLYLLRMHLPDVPVIIITRRILFSDRILAEYLGMTWLREYDSAIAAWPGFCLTDIINSEVFSGPEASVPQVISESIMSPEIFRYNVNRRLKYRLQFLFTDCPYMDSVIEGLVKELPVKILGESISLSCQTVYDYRKKIMKELRIQHYEREFIRSLRI